MAGSKAFGRHKAMSDTIAISAIELHKRQGIVTVSVKVDDIWYDVLAAGLYGNFVAEVDVEGIRDCVALGKINVGTPA